MLFPSCEKDSSPEIRIVSTRCGSCLRIRINPMAANIPFMTEEEM